MMRVQFHCSYCELVFNNEDDCRKHEIEKHAQGKAPKFERGDIVKCDGSGYSYYIDRVAYFSNARNQWVYSMEGTHETITEDGLSLVCKKGECRKLYESATELAEALFGDRCTDSYYSCLRVSIRLDRHFLFTVPISTDQVLEYMANKNKEGEQCD